MCGALGRTGLLRLEKRTSGEGEGGEEGSSVFSLVSNSLGSGGGGPRAASGPRRAAKVNSYYG